MTLFLRVVMGYLCVGMIYTVQAQGPPITADKPIMLGSNSKIVKTLTEVRHTNEVTWVKAPIIVHYLPTSNTLIGVHVPFVYSEQSGEGKDSYTGLGDIELLGKYQFYRKDGKGKTFRLVAKALQTFPTANNLNVRDIGRDAYQTYVGMVAGYESIKYGVSNELGYRFVSNGYSDELNYKLGFGLPLLKPSYPVKQINLYFEYNHNFLIDNKDYELLYAQGIQYAINRYTFEAAVQFPLVQTTPEEQHRKYSVFLGTRVVF